MCSLDKEPEQSIAIKSVSMKQKLKKYLNGTKSRQPINSNNFLSGIIETHNAVKSIINE